MTQKFVSLPTSWCKTIHQTESSALHSVQSTRHRIEIRSRISCDRYWTCTTATYRNNTPNRKPPSTDAGTVPHTHAHNNNRKKCTGKSVVIEEKTNGNRVHTCTYRVRLAVDGTVTLLCFAPGRREEIFRSGYDAKKSLFVDVLGWSVILVWTVFLLLVGRFVCFDITGGTSKRKRSTY